MKIKKLTQLKYQLLSAVLLCITTTVSAFVTVGSTADCDYDNLLDAYNDADVFVRITSQQTYSDVFTISKTKWFTGGYDTCAAAETNTLGQFKTKWTGSNNGTVVKIDANNPATAIVTLDRFEIFDGLNIFFAGAGGIKVSGNSSLILANSEVHDNAANEGGGIRVRGANAQVTVTNSSIFNNTSTSAGAGVYCESDAHFTMIGDSVIRSNIATGNGGGIFGNADCQITVLSGDSLAPLNVQLGIIGNQAAKGAGVYLKSGADMTLTGNDEHPASIVGNISNTDTSPLVVGGGGVYIIDAGTTFTATNARIDFNIAQNVGAGIGVLDEARFIMGRLDTACWDNDKCSSISDNIVLKATGDAAAGFIFNQATADISGTYIGNNQANETAVFVIEQVAFLRLEGSLIVDNTSFGQPFASKLFSVKGNNGFAGNLDFFYNTLTSNNANATFFLDGTSSQQFVRINNSIIRDQGDIIETTGAINPALTIACNYVHEIASLTVAQNPVDNFNFNPEFVDSANGDYHVTSQSLSKDLCNEDSIQSNYNGLNGNVRGFDDPNVINLRGPFDAGAYEQNNDLIFSSGFD